MNRKGIIIAGPTSVGKTSLSVALAQELGGEIVSADSMQIYKDMNIGTAKVTKEEMQGIPHHLIDIVEPDKSFSVSDYKSLAETSIDDIFSRNKVPIITGGTGLYFDSILFDMRFNDASPNTKYREELNEIIETKGKDVLYSLLLEKNPIAAEKIHPNNIKRVIRALEVSHEERLFNPYSNLDKNKGKWNFDIYILSLDREILYNRINQRVDLMLENGLLDEVMLLKSRGYTTDMQSMKGIGYRQLIDYLDGNISFEEAIDLTKRDSRRYAKRQITWFKKYDSGIWLDTLTNSSSSMIEQIKNNYYHLK